MRPTPERARPRPPAEPAVRKVDGLSALRDLFALILACGAPGLRWRLAAALTLTLGGKVLGVLAPLLLGAAVNSLAAGQAPAVQVGTAFAGLIVGWTLIRFLAAAAPQLRDVVFTPVAQAAQRRAAADAFGHALSLSIDFHQTKRTGSLSRTIERGSRAMDFLLRALVFNLGPTFIELIIAAGVLASAYDWRFALAAVATVLVYGALTFAISDWRIAHRRALNDADSEAAGRAVDALINYETVKAFGAETRAAADYDRALATYARAQVLATNSLSLLNLAQSAIMGVGLAAMALLAGFEAQAGRLGPGDVTAAILILINLYGPLNILGFAYREIRQSFIDLEAMSDLRRQSPDVAEAPDALDPPPSDGRGGAVVFADVSFRHGARSQGLEGVSFTAAPGETIALVGPSGGGKTTILNLIPRFYDADRGVVSVNGLDVREAAMADLRSKIALVMQEPFLFDDTIRANIAYARPEATDEEIAAAARAAAADEFIERLPKGYDTGVGEAGARLSGGQRQRIAIARAFLKDAPILLLDEATSALDTESEAKVQEALERLMVGRTTVMIAHRLSTVRHADRIYVIDAGRVAEQGTHASLVRKGGLYARLARGQNLDTAAPQAVDAPA